MITTLLFVAVLWSRNKRRKATSWADWEYWYDTETCLVCATVVTFVVEAIIYTTLPVLLCLVPR